ncbi:unnamed protein product [Ixodes pacificus]
MIRAPPCSSASRGAEAAAALPLAMPPTREQRPSVCHPWHHSAIERASLWGGVPCNYEVRQPIRIYPSIRCYRLQALLHGTGKFRCRLARLQKLMTPVHSMGQLMLSN